MMKPKFHNISGTYTVVLPEIWHQNVTVSQIAVLFILNLFSFHLQSILLAVLPNICLLILYLIFNNIVICKGSNDEHLSKHAQYSAYPGNNYMSQFESNYPSINFPFPGQFISISPYDLKDPRNLNSMSNNSYSCKNKSYSSFPIITTASSTITTTSATNCVKPRGVSSTVTTFTSSSSPITSVASLNTPVSFEPGFGPVISCIHDVSGSESATKFISPVTELSSVNSSNTDEFSACLPISNNKPISSNLPNVFSERSSQNVIPSPVLTSLNESGPKIFENVTKHESDQNVPNDNVIVNELNHKRVSFLKNFQNCNQSF